MAACCSSAGILQVVDPVEQAAHRSEEPEEVERGGGRGAQLDQTARDEEVPRHQDGREPQELGPVEEDVEVVAHPRRAHLESHQRMGRDISRTFEGLVKGHLGSRV